MLNCPNCKTELILIPAPDDSESLTQYINKITTLLQFQNSQSNLLQKKLTDQILKATNLQKFIKLELIKNNTSGAAIARKVKRHRVTVYDVISGKSKSKKIRQAISDAINTPISDLWPDTNQKGENNA